MKTTIKKVSIAVCLASMMSSTSYAANLTDKQLQQMIDKEVSQKTQALQNEVNQLERTVSTLNSQLKQKSASQKYPKITRKIKPTRPVGPQQVQAQVRAPRCRRCARPRRATPRAACTSVPTAHG